MTLRDYLDYIEPIPGQPGLFRGDATLFRNGRDLVPRNARDASGFEIAASRAPRRTYERIEGAKLGCNCGLDGLGATSIETRLGADWAIYLSLKDETQRIFARYPGALEPATFERFVRRLVELHPTPDTLVRLSAEQLAMLLKGGLSVVVRNLGLAWSMTSSSRTGERQKLIETAERTMSEIRRLLNALRTAEGVSGSVGLGIAIADDVVIAAIAVVGVVIVAALVIAFLSQVAVAVEAYTAAERACERDAAAGHPCTGAQGERYRAEARAASASFGVVPQFQNMLQPLISAGANVIFWGGLALVGYFVWTTLPAATEAREGMRQRVRRSA